MSGLSEHQTTGCIWKAPKLIKLFQGTSEQLIKQLSTCTGPWVNGLLGFNETFAAKGETPWFILVDLLQSWLANLGRKHPEEAKLIGHQARDMIRSCSFAGKKCDVERDFRSVFFSQHGNCFSYNTVSKLVAYLYTYVYVQKMSPKKEAIASPTYALSARN